MGYINKKNIFKLFVLGSRNLFVDLKSAMGTCVRFSLLAILIGGSPCQSGIPTVRLVLSPSLLASPVATTTPEELLDEPAPW